MGISLRLLRASLMRKMPGYETWSSESVNRSRSAVLFAAIRHLLARRCYASHAERRHTRKPGVHHGSHTCLYPRFHHPILWYPKLAFSFAGSGRRGQERKDLVHHFA